MQISYTSGHKIDLLQSQAPAERKLLGYSAVRTLGVMYNMTPTLVQRLFLTQTVTIYRDIVTLCDKNIVLTKLDVI